MDKSFREACLYHHDIDYIIADDFKYAQEAGKLILMMKISEYVINMKRKQNDYEWPKIKEFTLYYSGLNENGFNELCDQMLATILASC